MNNEKMRVLKFYLAKTLRDVKRFEKNSDEELYQRGINVTKYELKRAQKKLYKCLCLKNMDEILREYEYYMSNFDDISKYFSKCNELISEYRKNKIS